MKKEKIINFLKNFVVAMILFLIINILYFVVDYVFFMWFIILLFSVGLEMYQGLYAKAKFNMFDVIIRIIGCGAGWHLLPFFYKPY